MEASPFLLPILQQIGDTLSGNAEDQAIKKTIRNRGREDIN